MQLYTKIKEALGVAEGELLTRPARIARALLFPFSRKTCLVDFPMPGVNCVAKYGAINVNGRLYSLKVLTDLAGKIPLGQPFQIVERDRGVISIAEVNCDPLPTSIDVEVRHLNGAMIVDIVPPVVLLPGDKADISLSFNGATLKLESINFVSRARKASRHGKI